MNELYFFLHILILVSLVLVALRLGKETLLTCFALQAILGNLFVTKQMECFGLTITCSDVYTIGALFSLNLLQEYFGKKLAKKAIWIVFFTLFFFIVMSQIHLKYVPSSFDTTQSAFTAILASTPRIMIASFFVAFLTQKLDVELYGFFKKRLPEKALLFRFGGAALFTQLLDTILFSFLGLYGLVHSMTDIIVMSYLIKVVVIFCIAPFTAFSRRMVIT